MVDSTGILDVSRPPETSNWEGTGSGSVASRGEFRPDSGCGVLPREPATARRHGEKQSPVFFTLVQRFRFCGDLDAPDWILAEITVLSKISSVRFKLLVGQVITSLLGQQIDYAKVAKLTADAHFALSDIKAIVAALEFIVRSAAKYDCDDGTLANELQQLGMPKEHSEALVRPYREKREVLRDTFRSQTLSLAKLERADWRVDYVMSSSHAHTLNQPAVQLCLAVRDPAPHRNLMEHLDDPADSRRTVSFELSPEKLRVLTHELQSARAILDAVE